MQIASRRDLRRHPFGLDLKAPPPDDVRTSNAFDFASRSAHGHMLFVGEGNLSFARSVAERARVRTSIVATTYEPETRISGTIMNNADALRTLGARVLHGVDATGLDRRFRQGFRTIVFQFPNAGSRCSVYGGTANHHLVRRFLRSCRKVLAREGIVAITTVDRPYYHGLFDLPGAAETTGFSILSVHPFFRTHWPGYGHVNTLDVGSALRASYRACTWVLAPRPISSRPM